MKKITSWLACAAGIVLFLQACDKKEMLPFYKNGNAPVLSSSATTVAAAPADSSSPVVNFSWTSPGYGTDSNTVRYIIEIDSAGKSFSSAVKRTVTGELNTEFTGKELNEILIGFGFKSGIQYSIDARLTSSYANSNDMYQSNTVSLQVTPYKVPPKIPVPAELIIVGDATGGNWDNPAADPKQAIAQRFALLDETTYGGIFFLYGGGQYLMLPKSGNWDHKFGGESINGGELLVDGAVPGSNTPAPTTDGWYKIIVDFQTGNYEVTAVADPLPQNLYAIGDATPVVPQWDPGVVGGQELTRLNSTDYETSLVLTGTKNLKFISAITQWQPQFGKGSADGLLAANYGGGTDPGTIVPDADGTYKIEVSLLSNTYKLTKQ